MAPKVSVVIAVYNVEKYLRECLDSIISQTLRDIEIICVDDGSSDSSAAILAEYKQKDPRVILLAQSNGGAGTARNAGLAAAAGEYVSFLDSDDRFSGKMLETAYNACTDADADIGVFGCDMFDDRTGRILPGGWALRGRFLPAERPFDCHGNPDGIFFAFVGWAWDKLFRRSFLAENNLYFQSLRTTNDMYFTFTALLAAKRIITIDGVFAHQRRREGDSLSVTREKSWDCFLTALDALEEYIRKRGMYAEFERAFINYALHFSLWNFNSITGPSREKLYDVLKGTYFPKWQLGLRDAAFFMNGAEYAQYRQIMASRYEEYEALRIRNLKRERLLAGPRKIRNGIRCVREYGAAYALGKLMAALGLGKNSKA